MKSSKVIWFASSNLGKINDLKEILADYQIYSLLDLKDELEIKETGSSFKQNAMIKAKTLANLINQPVLANDAGLVVEGLNGFPGIYSKRWAAPITDWNKINSMLLEKMKNITNRNAKFVDVFAYYDPINKVEKYYTDFIVGTIAYELKGNNGYGYDPIFQLNDMSQTLSELDDDKRNYRFKTWSKELKNLIEIE